ncbi:hypothetical protein BH09MYX1_BH09MYX1_60870 [soil metagenome]
MRAYVGFAFITLASACADTTTPLETSAVDPSTIVSNVVVNGNGSAVTVQLRWFSKSDTTRLLVLGGGDRLVARAADATERDLAAVDDQYFVLIPTKASSITIALVRPTGEIAIDVPLPVPFVVTAPAGPVSRAQPITLTWAPSPGPVDLRVASACFVGAISRRVAEDTGSFTFYPGDFGTGVAACSLDVVVSRSTYFTTKTPLALGGPTAQLRTIHLETTP